jgi:hypothetical protein
VAGDDARTRLTTGPSGPGTGRVRATRPRSPEIARARMDGTDFFLSSTSVVYVAPTSSVVNPRGSVRAAEGCHGIGALIAAKELLLITTQKWLKPVLHTSRGFSSNRSFSREYFFSRNHSTLLESTLVLDSTTRVHHWSKPTIDMKLKKRENPGGLHVPSEEVIVGNQIKMLSTR